LIRDHRDRTNGNPRIGWTDVRQVNAGDIRSGRAHWCQSAFRNPSFPTHHDDHACGAFRSGALALGAGVGAELRVPLGIAIIGGLIVSQVLTLYATPVIYLWFARIGRTGAAQMVEA
jgi:hypothetical protein